MLNANSKMVEFENVVVVIRGEEVNLGELSYNEFSELMNNLTDDEIQEVLDQIVEAVGEEGFMKFIVNLQTLVEEELGEELEENERIHVQERPQGSKEREPQKPQGKQQPVILDPIKFVDMNGYFALNPELVAEGIDEVSAQVGKYMAFVNAGLTNEQAYELITIEAKRAHELAMADKQLELEQIKAETQLRGASVKQILNR